MSAANGLRQCEAKCAALGGTPACLASQEESDWVMEQIRLNYTSTLNFVPFGGKGYTYWGTLHTNVSLRERTEELNYGLWIGRFEKAAPECAGDGRLSDACWSECTSGAHSTYTNWAPEQFDPTAFFNGAPLLPQQPDDWSPRPPTSMDSGFNLMYAPNSAACVVAFPHLNGTWNDALCDYGWVSHIPFAGLYECLCEEGATDAAADLEFDQLEARSLDVFHTMRQSTVTAFIVFMLLVWLLPVLIHIAVCRCRRRRRAKTDPAATSPLVEASALRSDAEEEKRKDEKEGALLQSKIAHVAESARRQREFVGGVFTWIGWGVWSMILFQMFGGLLAGVATTPIVGHAKVYGSFLPWAWCAMLLAITPVDRVSINVMCGFNLLFTGLFTFAMGIMCTLMGFVGIFGFTYFGAGFGGPWVLLISGSGWVELLVVCCKSCCCERVPPRVRLNTLWRTLRRFLFAFGSFHLLFASYLHMPVLAQPDLAIMVFMCPSFLINSLLWTPRNRGKALQFINKLGHIGHKSEEAEEEMQAATVAALIGGTDPGSAYKMATDNFRAIPLCEITKSDLDSNQDTNMAEKTEEVRFGEVAAFITHSWSDPGGQKFEALQEWGQEYREKNGGKEPLVWLDKACVNQANVDEALTALPVFLAGCEELVVLNGPSYSSRLWCAMEIFTFLKMGGTKGRVNAFKLGKGKTPRRMKSNPLERFDASKATCFKLSDKHKLLAVIETGAGSLHQFNAQVRNLFTDGKRGSIMRMPSMERRKSSSTLDPPRDLDAEVKV